MSAYEMRMAIESAGKACPQADGPRLIACRWLPRVAARGTGPVPGVEMVMVWR